MADTCPSCSEPIDASDRFCGECGAALPVGVRTGEKAALDQVISGFRTIMVGDGKVEAAQTALTAFEAGIRQAAEMPEAYFGKGVCLAELDRLREALLFVDQALQHGLGSAERPILTVEMDRPGSESETLVLDVDRSWALLVRADILLGLDRHAEALAQLDDAQADGVSGSYADDLEAMRAIALVACGRLDEAEIAVQEAKDWNDASARVAEAEGRLRLAQGRLDESLAAFTSAIDRDPDDADYLVLRAKVLKNLDRRPAARADLVRSRALLTRDRAIAPEIGAETLAEIEALLAAL